MEPLKWDGKRKPVTEPPKKPRNIFEITLENYLAKVEECIRELHLIKQSIGQMIDEKIKGIDTGVDEEYIIDLIDTRLKDVPTVIPNEVVISDTAPTEGDLWIDTSVKANDGIELAVIYDSVISPISTWSSTAIKQNADSLIIPIYHNGTKWMCDVAFNDIKYAIGDGKIVIATIDKELCTKVPSYGADEYFILSSYKLNPSGVNAFIFNSMVTTTFTRVLSISIQYTNGNLSNLLVKEMTSTFNDVALTSK